MTRVELFQLTEAYQKAGDAAIHVVNAANSFLRHAKDGMSEENVEQMEKAVAAAKAEFAKLV